MHRRPEANLLPLNTEIERALQNLRRITVQNLEIWHIKETDCRLFQKKKKKYREIKGLILWSTFGGLLSKRSTLQ